MPDNILVVTELFYPNKTSTAHIMTEIAKYLNIRNNVSVLCADIKYDDNIEKREDSQINDLNIKRIRTPQPNKNSVVSRLFSAVQISISFGWNIFKSVRRGDMVLAVTNPVLLVLVLAFIKSFKKFKYILLVHDVFPENAVPAGLVNDKSRSYSLTKKLYDWAYSKADKLIVLGRDMAELIAEKIGDESKVKIVENWFDEDIFGSLDFDRSAYTGCDLSNKVVIGFAGNIGRVQNVDKFLEIFRQVNNPNLHFVIVGNGAMSPHLEKMIKDYQMPNVSYLGSKPRSEQAQFLNCCDIGLVTLKEGMLGLGVPSKSYNLLALQKPILFIGDKNSEIDRLISEENIGWSFSWSETDSLKRFLQTLEGIHPQMKEKAGQLANDKFSRSVILKKFYDTVTL